MHAARSASGVAVTNNAMAWLATAATRFAG